MFYSLHCYKGYINLKHQFSFKTMCVSKLTELIKTAEFSIIHINVCNSEYIYISTEIVYILNI